MVFLASCLAATSNINTTTTKWQQKNLNNNQRKLLKYAKLNLKKTRAWFRSPFMSSGQETDPAYSTVPAEGTYYKHLHPQPLANMATV